MTFAATHAAPSARLHPILNIVFDLDGTLFDSLPSIERSAALAVAQALPEMPPPDLRCVVGPPIAQMFAKLWPDLPPERMDALLAAFRAIYDSTGCLEAVPYPGVISLLRQWHQQGIRLFLLTNKPEKPTLAILEHHGLISLFTDILCPDSASPFASKPSGASLLAQRHRLPPASTALVGDGGDDAESAALCGFRFFHASYGYGRVDSSEGFTSLKEFSTLHRILHPEAQP